MPFGRLVRALGLARERAGESAVERSLGRYARVADRIAAARAGRGALSVDAIGSRAAGLAGRVASGTPPEDVLVDWYSLVADAIARRLGLAVHRVQTIAAVALAGRRLVEMPTGEGKTLVAVFAASLSALAGGGVHVLTWSDYLARRDADWMGPIYRNLGLSVAHVEQGMSTAARQAAYRADVTYATAKEVGFDVLRDGLVADAGDLVHRSFARAIVDEADSILIDEARVPLVIARPGDEPPIDPIRARAIVANLEEGRHHALGANRNRAILTEAGTRLLEERLGCGSLYDPENQALLATLDQAVQAHVLLRRGEHYIVSGETVELVDEFTGRVVRDRRWPDGLQAAVEAKEGLSVRPQGVVYGTMTIQALIGLYDEVSALTATARSAADEFLEIYDLRVVVVGPDRPSQRVDEPDRVFADHRSKMEAVVEEIRRAHRAGQPVLVGTRTVEESERLGRLLDASAVEHRILNARNEAEEAAIIAAAGAPGAVTISTNMAGRGTDIVLGGPDGSGRQVAVATGGLLVIGTQRHESRRIDDQLRGRAGRQGDPGRSVFLIALDDFLLARYEIREMLGRLPVEGRIDDPAVGQRIAHAQRVIEGEHFSIRRQLRRYRLLLEEQRKAHIGRRHRILTGQAALELDGTPPAGPDVRRRATLAAMDDLWAEHLSRLADLEDDIHLDAMTANDPLQRFRQSAVEAWHEMAEALEGRVLARLATGVDDAASALPSTTWTYLVDDNPFGYWFDRAFGSLIAGLRRRL